MVADLRTPADAGLSTPPQPPRPRWYTRKRVLLPLTAVVSWTIGAVMAMPAPAPQISTPPAPAATETVAEVVTETAPPAGPAAVITTAGTYLVGTDIEPGTYRNPEGCYWARLSGVSGELNDIIANDGGSDGPSIVEISASDYAFETNCGGWSRAS